MRFPVRLIIVLISIIVINGCTFFQDKDAEILPAELINFDENAKYSTNLENKDRQRL